MTCADATLMDSMMYVENREDVVCVEMRRARDGGVCPVNRCVERCVWRLRFCLLLDRLLGFALAIGMASLASVRDACVWCVSEDRILE